MFAKLIRSSPSVRATFEGISGVALWWRLVLCLHGKPVAMAGADSKAILRKGFRFYAWLYLLLAIPVLLMSLASLLWRIPDLGHLAYLGLIGSLYLCVTSQLAFKGSQELCVGNRRGAVLLIAFFVAIMLFSAVFCTCALTYSASIQAAPTPVLYAIYTFLLFMGIGSYMIELVYLAWMREGQEGSGGEEPRHSAQTARGEQE